MLRRNRASHPKQHMVLDPECNLVPETDRPCSGSGLSRCRTIQPRFSVCDLPVFRCRIASAYGPRFPRLQERGMQRDSHRWQHCCPSAPHDQWCGMSATEVSIRHQFLTSSQAVDNIMYTPYDPTPHVSCTTFWVLWYGRVPDTLPQRLNLNRSKNERTPPFTNAVKCPPPSPMPSQASQKRPSRAVRGFVSAEL